MRLMARSMFLGWIILLLAIFCIFSACAEKKDWEKAKQANSAEAYQAFLKNHPEGRYVDKAKSAIEDLEWDKAIKTNTIGVYHEFLKKYPKSLHASEAKSFIDKFRMPLGKDGRLMVLIPAGEFQMGSSEERDDEKPVHTVYLDAFYIDVYEVTNADYKKFVDATGHRAPVHWNDPTMSSPTQPVVMVSWRDAVAYCTWAGKRLPTEAEWEKSARGGLVGKKFPWGDFIFHDNANFYDTGGKDFWEKSANVGTFDPNGYGLYDVAGNVQEWCADWYDSKYYATSPKQNPKGPSSGEDVVIRGGSWADESLNLLVAKRNHYLPDGMQQHIGFRCAMNANP